MNSHSKRDTSCSLRNPHFFKIILDDAIQNGKLMIPTNFVSKYGTNHLGNSVVLQVPDGRAWKVGLTKCDEEVWLRYGLREFMEYYSIDCGQFLTFRYDGNTTFSVTIFDRSATEIDYPYTSPKTEEYAGSDQDNDSIESLGENLAYPKRKDKSSVEYLYTSSKTEYTESEDYESVESLGENKEYPKRKDKSPLVSSRPQKLRRTCSIVKTEISPEDIKGEINPRTGKDEEPTSAGLRSPESNNIQTVQQQLTESEKKANCFLRASTFTSNNPFFTVSMRPYYVCLGTKRILYVPKWFARKYLVDKEGPAFLHYSDRTWVAKYRREASSGVLCGGWSTFVEDNNLKVGDVCVLELLEGHRISLNVYIFRLDEIENCWQSANCSEPEKSPNIHIKSDINDCNGDNAATQDLQKLPNSKVPGRRSSSTLNREEIAIALQKASDFKSRNPYFVIVMQPSYVNGKARARVPPYFVNQYLNQKHCEVSLRVPDGRTWTIPLVSNGHRRCKFGNKWMEFAKQNNLKVLDACVFELIDGLRNSFIVVVFSNGEKKHCSPSQEAQVKAET